MIVSEVYNRQNLPPLLHIYSDNGYFLTLNNQIFRDAYVANEDEISKYSETNIPLPPSIATNDFICNVLITNNQLTEQQILNAQPIIEKALNTLPDKEAYYASFLYKPLDTFKEYQVGERFLYQNKLYNTIQVALGSKMLGEDYKLYFEETEYPKDLMPEWKENQEYRQNDKVKYGEHVYKSLIDNNMWSPQDFLDAWRLVE